MVKKIVFIAISAVFNLTSAVLFAAGEFTASVNSPHVHLHESFSLTLTLKDISPKGAPAVSALKDHFVIHSQQQSANTTISNGKISSSITWKLSLTPKVEGAVEIPSITVETADGPLSTQPISLAVVKDPAPQSNADSSMNMITKVSNASPYNNEPFVYTALLTSKIPLYHVQIQKMQVEDAIVELLEEPKLEEKIIDGILHYAAEFNYLITPLKTGELTIPSIAIQGVIPQKNKKQLSSIFDDDFDPFSMMQGFGRAKPFTATTEKIQLEIQPPVPELSPWLPAKALRLEEIWPADQTLRVGEPFSRGVVIRAEGLKASQLPHLEEMQGQSASFKIYADKPEEEEKIVQGAIHSLRKEHYTLIPQQPGSCVLPEISISWWDSSKKEARTSILPARTVHILPAVETGTSTPEEAPSHAATTPSLETPAAPIRPPFLLYGVIAMLSCSLIAALLWGFALRRQLAGPAQTSKPAAPPPPKKPQPQPTATVQKEKKEKLPDLNPT